MYGSSFRIETRSPRALSSRPMLAAVIPFPREEVTPPVTKTYFATDQDLRGFFQCYRNRVPGDKEQHGRGAPLPAVRGVHQLRDVLVDVEVLVVDEDDRDRLRRRIHGEDRAVARLAAREADGPVERGVEHIDSEPVAVGSR